MPPRTEAACSRCGRPGATLTVVHGLERHGVGPQVAAQLLATAGDNPARLRSEAAVSLLCGVAPLLASSGKTHRHRLNRGGDRDANSALHTVVLTRMRNHPPTLAYLERWTKEGLSRREIRAV
ncbi:MAG: transposase [Frankiales bacterium]|nr:transposase [Frankiales bacterium]